MSAIASVGTAGIERYAERTDQKEDWLTKLERIVVAAPRGVYQRVRQRRRLSKQARVNALEDRLRRLTDEQLRSKAVELRSILRTSGYEAPEVVEVFALVRETTRRILGLRHHDVQILAGFAMLDGAICEMDTGEGKTVSAALTAVAAAFAGIPVHVITVNEYLAVRDCATLAPVYEFLGLTVAAITHEAKPPERVQVYRNDIVYASNKEIAFDYLRDRIVLGARPNMLRLKLNCLSSEKATGEGLVMRGLHFAIVDEADSVLVDEARTPLIISRGSNSAEEKTWAQQAFQMIEGFGEGTHYLLRREDRRIEITPEGKTLLEERAEFMGSSWRNPVRREEAARQALSAIHLFSKGEHYLVHEGKVQIVDEYTGRVMADRSWSDGLHQMVELKEECEITSRKFAIARMTYQRFFRRYLRLAGMTGTAREVRSELWSVYKIGVQRIPPNRPSLRAKLKTSICQSQPEKWQLIAERTVQENALGRPVLIGTRSVTASQTVSKYLGEAGIEHVVLNAENSDDEAEIIAQAGHAGRVTVATNMAGRGVDIDVPDDVCRKGGLHVILSERHDSSRIDRQMEGRTGRRGQPGSCEAVLSLDDPLLELLPKGPILRLGGRLDRISHWYGLALFELAQMRAQRTYAIDRRNLLAQDQRLGVLLAFSGGME